MQPYNSWLHASEEVQEVYNQGHALWLQCMVGGAIGMDMFSSSEHNNHKMHNYNGLETTKGT